MSLLHINLMPTTSTCTGRNSPRMNELWARYKTFPLRMSRFKIKYTTYRTTMKATYCQRCSPFHTNISRESSQTRAKNVSPNYNSLQYLIGRPSWRNRLHLLWLKANLVQILTRVSRRLQLRGESTYLQKMQLTQLQTRLRLNLALMNLNKMHIVVVLANLPRLLKQQINNSEKI